MCNAFAVTYPVETFLFPSQSMLFHDYSLVNQRRRQPNMHRSRLDLGQTTLSARFNESGYRPIATLSAGPVM